LQHGSLFGAKKIKVGYFAQHQLDELDPRETPYDVIERLMPDATEAARRARLGAHGFGVEKADTKSERLSGGEKARLLLMIAAFDGPNLLILDEPTNHLDVDSRQALVRGLNEFDGAVIIISHDRHLIEATVDRLWVVRAGGVTVFDGSMDDYRRTLLEDRGGSQKDGAKTAARNGGPETAGLDRAEERRLAAEARSKRAPLKKEAERLEAKVARIADHIGKLDAALAKPELYETAPDKAQTYAAERGRLARLKDETEEAWLDALEAYETASGDAGSAA
ncbi:MAG: ATP-binding cassette domain-containing protein, partial [Pseudomonadota bacterium]